MRRIRFIPIIWSLLFAIAAFVICLVILRPGYYINDDLKIIRIIYGYPAGNPVPFPIQSNVLLGLILVHLYALPINLNWEIIFFMVVNFVSLWGILYIVLSPRTVDTLCKFIETLAVIGCDVFFILNITYTLIAAFAAIAGICLIWAAALRAHRHHRGIILLWGMLLLVIASLIRLKTLALLLPPAIVAMMLTRSAINIKYTALSLAATGLLILGFYGFDQAYVSLSPGWHEYYEYTATRQNLHDTHRLQNLHGQIKAVGWTKNDQELFARWFFPDQTIYSLQNLQYLVEHVSGAGYLNFSLVVTLFRQLFSKSILPYVLLIVALGLFALRFALPLPTKLALLLSVLTALAENLYLEWTMKDPERVLLPSLAGTAIFGIMLLNGSDKPFLLHFSKNQKSVLHQIPQYAGALCLVAAGGLFAYNSRVTTINHTKEQNEYRQILKDLKNLQIEGKLAQNANIVSTSHGLPLEWAYPFTLDLPDIPYLDTGWITFSPTYEQVLQKYDIQSLPRALYQKSNLYLMTNPHFTVFLDKYYEEHENINVAFKIIYAIPNIDGVTGYDDIKLYKIIQTK